MKYNIKNKNKGFVALFTVLIAAVILSMAVGISTLALKQIFLTASSTDANKSFYAADAGIECALYHDLRGTPPNSFDAGFTSNISCGGNAIDALEGFNPGVFTGLNVGPVPGFWVSVGANQEFCAYVTVDKSDPTRTRVISRGINLPCGESGPRMVERAIEVTY